MGYPHNDLYDNNPHFYPHNVGRYVFWAHTSGDIL